MDNLNRFLSVCENDVALAVEAAKQYEEEVINSFFQILILFHVANYFSLFLHSGRGMEAGV